MEQSEAASRWLKPVMSQTQVAMLSRDEGGGQVLLPPSVLLYLNDTESSVFHLRTLMGTVFLSP